MLMCFCGPSRENNRLGGGKWMEMMADRQRRNRLKKQQRDTSWSKMEAGKPTERYLICHVLFHLTNISGNTITVSTNGDKKHIYRIFFLAKLQHF